MAKMILCNQTDLASGCKKIVIGHTEEDVLRKAAEHAKEHGILEFTSDRMQKLRDAIRECPWEILDTTR